jgi:hypothetical protein
VVFVEFIIVQCYALKVFISSEHLTQFCRVELGLNLNSKLTKHDSFYMSL